jgi:hypothetical protein
MTTDKKDIMEQLSRVLTIIPQQYVDTLIFLYKKLADKDVEWSVNGDLGEALRAVNVEPDCIELLTSKEGAERILKAVQDLEPTQISLQTRQLARNAVVEEKEYPVYVRSHYFEFNVNGVKVKVQGDLQYRVNDWDWGDTLEFTPEHVNVVGCKIAVVPLQVKHEMYTRLGWMDRAEKIEQVTEKRRPQTPG